MYVTPIVGREWDHLSTREEISGSQEPFGIPRGLRQLLASWDEAEQQHIHVAWQDARHIWGTQAYHLWEEEPIWRGTQGMGCHNFWFHN